MRGKLLRRGVRLCSWLHRKVGSLLSVIMLVWCLSGVILIFTGFPNVDREELLTRSSSLTVKDSIISISHFNTERYGKIKEFKLLKIGEQPYYKITTNSTVEGRDTTALFSAYDFTPISNFTESQLDKVVATYFDCGVDRKIALNDFDSWIPWSRLGSHFPIFKYSLSGDDHRVIYISSLTGEIVQSTTRGERWGARFGAIPHWLYFKSLRLNSARWSSIVITISFIGACVTFLGLILGFYRLFKRRKVTKRRKGVSLIDRVTPFKATLYRYHHIFGLIFGLSLFCFVLSGMFSLYTPSCLVSKDRLYRRDFIANQNRIDSDIKLSSIPSISEIIKDREGIKTIEEQTIDRELYYLINGEYLVDLFGARVNLKEADLDNYIKNVIGDSIAFNIDMITEPDNYYTGGRRGNSFPVYKVNFKELSKTIYFDKEIFTPLYEISKEGQVMRWLYRGLHSFNTPWLLDNEWLRCTLLILLSLGGGYICWSAIRCFSHR